MKTMAETAGLNAENLTNHSARKRMIQKLNDDEGAFDFFPLPAFFNSFCFAKLGSVSLDFLNPCPSMMAVGKPFFRK